MRKLTAGQLQQVLRRARTDRDTSGPVPIPRRPRPQVVIRVHRQHRDLDTQQPEPGTLTVDPDGVSAVLYVGRNKHWTMRALASTAETVRPLLELEILAHTQVAGEDARRTLNRCWRLTDIEHSGRLPTGVTDRILRPK